jgi:hypothetical protein
MALPFALAVPPELVREDGVQVLSEELTPIEDKGSI